MEFYLIAWLELSGIGILFGLFPAWFSCGGMIYRAVVLQHKNVPSWLCDIASSDLRTDRRYRGLLPKRYISLVPWIISTIWVIACLVGQQYLALVDYARGNIAEIIVINTSFPVFLVLTWLLPAYFLRRYLQKLEIREEEPIKIEYSLNQRRRSALYFALYVILFIVLFIFLFWGKPLPLTSPGMIISILSLGVLCYFAILVNVRVRRKNKDHFQEPKDDL